MNTTLRRASAVLAALFAANAFAQTRDVPAKALPVPETVSPQIQKLIAAPLSPTYNQIPATHEEWKKQIGGVEAATAKGLPALREALKVKVEPTTLDGVKAYIVTPENIPPQNRNRLLVHVHGGGYVFAPDGRCVATTPDWSEGILYATIILGNM